MNCKRIVSLLILIIVLLTSINSYSEILSKDTYFTLDGKKIKFKEGTSIKYNSYYNTFAGGILAENTYFEIQGKKVLIKKGEAWFSPEGKIMQGILSKKTQLNVLGSNIELKANTILSLTQPEEIITNCTIDKTTYIPIMKGKKKLKLNGCIELEITYDGILIYIIINENTAFTINNKVIILKPGKIGLYEDHNIRGGTLAENTIFPIAGLDVSVEKGSILEFSYYEQLKSITFKNEKLLNFYGKKIKLIPDKKLYLSDNGEIGSFYISEDTVFKSGKNEIKFIANQRISFSSRGSTFPGNGVISKNSSVTIQKEKFKFVENKIAYFHSNGNLEIAIELEQLFPVKIQGKLIKVGQSIECYPDSSIKRTWLFETAILKTVKGKFITLHSGTPLFFNPEGLLIRWWFEKEEEGA